MCGRGKKTIGWMERIKREALRRRKKCVLGGDKVKTEFSFPLFYAFSVKSARRKRAPLAKKRTQRNAFLCENEFYFRKFFSAWWTAWAIKESTFKCNTEKQIKNQMK